MAKKAKRKREAAIRVRLPLDDPRWRPVDEIVDKLVPRIGDKMLIAGDLDEKLKGGKVRSMHRSVVIAPHGLINRPPKLLPASHWTEHCLMYWWNGDIRVALRPPPNHQGPWCFTWVVGALYLWLPDCEKAFALTPQKAHVDEAKVDERRKPGPRPREEWQEVVVIKWCTQRRAGKPEPTAAELAQFCANELGYPPAHTAISKLLRGLKRLLG
jgi:hypothetical protein